MKNPGVPRAVLIAPEVAACLEVIVANSRLPSNPFVRIHKVASAVVLDVGNRLS
jgi:hypothetical protein